MSKTIIKGGILTNRGKSFQADILINNDRIELIAPVITRSGAKEINAEGCYVFPGVIDDQVHFREPGLTYKANIASESRAAIAGGTTTFMEMPNTKPAALTQELLQDKYDIAAKTSFANYSFFMGASNDNLEEVLKTDKTQVCGIKAFMGSSTGNMLVDKRETLDALFSSVDMLIATHCEDEATIKANLAAFKEKYGEDIDATQHPIIRSAEGCYISSSFAVELAKKNNTRLHILHITTARELELFTNEVPLNNKRITSEVCVHHLNFDDTQYSTLGNKIKCNPAIKTASDRAALLQGLLDDKLDIIATDHAPHTIEEKANPYLSAPSGLPLIQHALDMMMAMANEGKLSKEKVIEKMCHAPAECFDIVDRGYLDEGKYADIVIYDPKSAYTVEKDNVLYKCGWSPLEGRSFSGSVRQTIINGVEVYNAIESKFVQGEGRRLVFDRKW